VGKVHLEKGDEYMGTHEANIEEIDSEHYLSLKIKDIVLKVPLTKDEPNEIKKVFNELILHLKKSPLSFTMKEVEDGDLIYYVAKEYIKQLNTELSEVYKELEAHQLLDQK
jgi:hypothetical protein